MDELNNDEWNKKLIKLGGHFYQSTYWGEFEQAQGRQVVREQGDGWLWQAVVREGRGGIKYLYAPYGPVIAKNADQALEALEALIAASHKLKVDFIKVEPWGLKTLQKPWQKVTKFQPDHIMRLNIAVSEQELRKNLTSSNRNLINQANARGLKFKISNDLNDFSSFMRQQQSMAKRTGITIYNESYYKNLAQTLIPAGLANFYFAAHADGDVASAICYDFGGVRYYAYAGTNDELNRKHKGAVALLWWMIIDAKNRGLHTFDFGGVAPANQPNHPWAGHTKFKRSVGDGDIIQLSGTWDYPLKSAKYKIYHAIKRFM